MIIETSNALAIKGLPHGGERTRPRAGSLAAILVLSAAFTLVFLHAALAGGVTGDGVAAVAPWIGAAEALVLAGLLGTIGVLVTDHIAPVRLSR